MMRALVLAMALAAGGCGAAPTPMAATQASEILAQFAAGAAPVDICTPQGRALLRGAVRAYGAEMARAGLAWPASPALGAAPDDVSSLDMTVQAAFATGFLEASDLSGGGRALARSFDDWPELAKMREAAHLACAEVAAMQQAAARFALEAARYRWLLDRADRDALAAERVSRQALLVERAQARMQMLMAQLDARLEAREG